jgi:hypothetical protein
MIQCVIDSFLDLAELAVGIAACRWGRLALNQVEFEDVVEDFLGFAEVEPERIANGCHSYAGVELAHVVYLWKDEFVRFERGFFFLQM